MFTFKNHERTGRYRSFQSQGADIKLKRKKVGQISEASHFDDVKPDERFSIRFTIVDDKEKCGWRWVKLKMRFDSIESAKDFLRNTYELILKKYDLYKLDS